MTIMTGDWRKASYSNPNGACVEVAGWRAARECREGDCLEAGQGNGIIGVRDTVQAGSPARTVVEFSAGAWRGFLCRIKTESLTV